MNQLKLSELHEAIKEILYGNFEDKYWIVAEISQLNENKQGHCYLELIEKDERDKTIAKSRANIWSFTYRHLKSYFADMSGEKLKAGMKVLVLASVEFHELYGYSLNITDIDPTYTLGDQAKKRLEIIKQLEEDGVMNMNKELDFVLAPQKIAIISSETAAGYGDFMNQLKENAYHYKFYTKLFPAVMQGDKAEESIISALEKIYEYEDFFELVVIIRGGGSKEELSCFDNYLLALNIAQYPIPVLTGIGHERDESIADLVSYKKLKTPTAVAEFLIENLALFDNRLDELFLKFKNIQENLLSEESMRLQNLSSNLKHFTKFLLSSEKNNISVLEEISRNKMQKAFLYEKNMLETIESKLSIITKNIFSVRKKNLINYSQSLQSINKFMLRIENNRLESIKLRFPISTQNNLKRYNEKLQFLKKELALLSPENVLNRGFALVRKSDKILKSSMQIAKGDKLSIEMKDGIVDVVAKK